MDVQISVYLVSLCVGVMFFNIVIIKVNKLCYRHSTKNRSKQGYFFLNILMKKFPVHHVNELREIGTKIHE